MQRIKHKPQQTKSLLQEKKPLPNKQHLPKKQPQVAKLGSTEQISRLLVTIDETPDWVPERKSRNDVQTFADGIHAVELVRTVYKHCISVTERDRALFEFPLATAGSFMNQLTVLPKSQNHIAFTHNGSIERHLVDFKNKKMKRVWLIGSYDPNLCFSGKIHISPDQCYWAVDLRGPNGSPTILHMRQNCYRTHTFLLDCSEEGLNHGKWIDSRFFYVRRDHSVCAYEARTHFKFVFGTHISSVSNPLRLSGYLFSRKQNNEQKNQALVPLGGNEVNKKMTGHIRGATRLFFPLARLVQQYASFELIPELPFPAHLPENIRTMLNQAYSSLDHSNQVESMQLRKAFIEELVNTTPPREKFSLSAFRNIALELLKKYEKIRVEMTQVINDLVPISSRLHNFGR